MSHELTMLRRIGIFGGTFNPIHMGHLLLAERAREKLNLDRVLFVPSAFPPHKDPGHLLPGRARLALIRLAIRGNPGFAVSDIEIRRGGVSYTLETVEAFRKQFPGSRLFLLVGQDMLDVKWRGWDKIRRLCRLVVAGRPGASARDGAAKWLDMPPTAIASSDIRSRIRAGKSIRYLVPEAVERSIRSGGWYGRAAR